MQKIRDTFTRLWRATPRAVRSGWITAWVTFIGVLVTILTGLLPALAEALSSRNFEPFYDSLNLGASAAVAAASAFVSGIVNSVYRWLRPIAESYKTTPPNEREDVGYVIPNLLIWAIAIGALIIIIWFIATNVIDVQDDDAIRLMISR